ncbi:putative non-specific serine/threonine protein kinase [Rosa chinensis]|uniref:Putative non-specific serine/threonine protein kinase n=1 Tax=Rosa chinensis TaxID=74649 RepID=A0A2P6Q8U5_ROSCH|nr:putative non-specific serine/threonine protein kinase [Rosa chinensis]
MMFHLTCYVANHQRINMLLDWPKRFDNINGIARGFLYLHQDYRVRVTFGVGDNKWEDKQKILSSRVPDHNLNLLGHKLKALKHCLRDWNKAVFGNVHQKVAAARENLVTIQQDIATRGMTDQRFEDEIAAKSAALDALRMQETYWKDRARVKWLTDGDRSTSFFHTYAKVRAAKSQMSSIRVGERILTDPSDIAAHTVAFYQNLYDISSPSTNVDEVCSVIPSLVTDDENVVLSAIPTSEEIRSAVFSMDGSSAPGPDGYLKVLELDTWIRNKPFELLKILILWVHIVCGKESIISMLDARGTIEYIAPQF